jgi:alpha-glucosidase
MVSEERLGFSVAFHEQPVLGPSPMEFSLDGADLTTGVSAGKAEQTEINETYPWYGAHAQATNHARDATIALTHTKSGTRYSVEIRAFNDGAAFRFIVPGSTNARVPDEATTFFLPAGSTVWYHDLVGHYEGVHVKKDISDIKEGDWAGPPVTYKLPGDAGYAALTEAALMNYAGMALQADGHRGFRVRLGHSQPPSHPYVLRYSAEDVARLAKPAEVTGTITTPWRVVMVGKDLNALVNSDLVPNLCPPPDKRLFPKGALTDWIKPGRAVWKYLDGGGSNTLSTAREFTRLAGILGFEHHIIEGWWSRFSDAEIKGLVAYANQQHVGIWVWKPSKSLRDPKERHEFLQHCHDLGITGVKIDFFDHEAKEVIDLYQALLREGAELHLLMNFHGANKPTGEARTWPNELNREAIKGMEASRLTDRATHDTTLPFTRLLAGHADYTPMHFGARRQNTTWAHQIASAAILGAPLLTYAANPAQIVTNACCEMIQSIPAAWDETVVLPPSEIGELAAFARRTGDTWFLTIMNGTTARKIRIPLSFLGHGNYTAALVRDALDGTATQTRLKPLLAHSDSLTVELQEGGGFVARFDRP